MAEFITKDSGARAQFETGAQRDLNVGKGRFDLMPPLAMQRLVQMYYGRIVTGLPVNALYYAFRALSGDPLEDFLAETCGELVAMMGGWWPAMERLAKLYERGAIKYDARNWEKGIPVKRMFESGLRHLCQGVSGLTDEDHYAGALFNFLGIMEYEERAECWDSSRYSDLFGDLGELYYRNNPQAMPSVIVRSLSTDDC